MTETTERGEIHITRVYEAPLRAVWDAWTVPEETAKWWGPRGFTLTTHAKDLRSGGTWRYTMHGPDGVDYPNVTKYLVVEPHRRLVYDHGGTDDRPALFRVEVSFAEANGKTTMTMVSTLPTREAAAEMAKFIKQAGGDATWDRLGEHLAETGAGRRLFVIHRSFDAPIASVFEMWTRPEHLAQWLPPAGTTLRFLPGATIAPGKEARFVITGAHGTMHVRATYLTIERPRLLVYTQEFVDADGRRAPPPGAQHWPATLRNTVLLTEEAPGRTPVTVTTEAVGDVVAAELDAFLAERAGMTLGWTGSFDALGERLARVAVA